jgi:PAS domain-containing protein
VSHVLARQIHSLSPVEKDAPGSVLRRSLDHTAEGVFILGETGVILHANETWCRWTGYSLDELRGSSAPYAFWITHRDLAHLGGELHFLRLAGASGTEQRMPLPSQTNAAGLTSPEMSSATAEAKQITLNRYPFRDREGRVFWCEAAALRDVVDARPVTFVYLRPITVPETSARPTIQREPSIESVPVDQTMALLLPPDSGPAFWTPQWEKITGLKAADLAGANRDLALDWLFPRERDRAYIADLLCRPATVGGQVALHLASPEGSKPVLCTFLPFNPGSDGAAPPGTPLSARTVWLLLVTVAPRSSAALAPSPPHSRPAHLENAS